MQQLHDALSRKPVSAGGRRSPHQTLGHRRANSWSELGPPNSHDYTYRAAAQKLRDLLGGRDSPANLPRRGIHFSPPRVSSPYNFSSNCNSLHPLTNSLSLIFRQISSGIVCFQWSELPHRDSDTGVPGLLAGSVDGSGKMPSEEELLAMLQQQGAYITQLELENKYSKVRT